MAILQRLTDKSETEIHMAFECVGCQQWHSFRTDSVQPNVPMWTWNKDMNRPTFTPSLLVNGNDPAARCHLFVRDGKIEYLGDSHHSLAGQTVDMVEIDWQ